MVIYHRLEEAARIDGMVENVINIINFLYSRHFTISTKMK